MTIPANPGFAGPYKLAIWRVVAVHTTALQAGFALITPATTPAGLYRVSMSIAITTAGTAGQLTMSAVATGEGGSTQTQSLAAVNVNTLGDLAQDAFAVSVASGAIGYKVDALGLTAGSLRYAVRFVVEQLMTP
jgi:hypothetical protein